MIYRIVDLYEYFGLVRPAGGAGFLKCMCPEPVAEIGPRRFHPAMLIIAGGAYCRVAEREREPVAFGCLRAGWAAFTLDYSCAPHSYPVALREAAMAMIYIKENAAGLHIRADSVCAMGFSAGGHLLGCLANLYGDGSCADLMEERGISPRPAAAVYCYPVVTTGEKTHRESAYNISGGDPELEGYLSIEKHITPDSPPAFIWHTYEDGSVPVKNSLLLASAYEAAGVPFALHIFEKGVHGMSTADILSYSAEGIPAHSTDMPGWLTMALTWLTDRGLRVLD